jgi:hypothetical protein
MFILKSEATFKWPVKALAPENGKHLKVEFEATFKILSQETINKLTSDGDMSSGSVRVMNEAVVNFTGIDVAEADGKKIDDDDHDRRIEIILQHPYMVKALSDAFAAGMAGHRIKN